MPAARLSSSVVTYHTMSEEYDGSGAPLSGTELTGTLRDRDAVPTKRRRRMAVVGLIVTDWVIALSLTAATAGLEFVNPRTPYIVKEDLPRLSFPLKEDTVPTWTVPLYAFLGPVIIMATVMVIQHRRIFPNGCSQPYSSLAAKVNWLVATYISVLFLSGFFTNLVKLYVGRPRPNFVARCWPDGNILLIDGNSAVNSTLQPMLVGGKPQCSNKDPKVWHEGLKSFPSGHTSWSAAGLSFFTWWLRDMFKPLGQGQGHAWQVLVTWTPMLGAVLVGVSRYVDYMHHWQDITVGFILGTFISWLLYHTRWPGGWTHSASLSHVASVNYVHPANGTGLGGSGAERQKERERDSPV